MRSLYQSPILDIETVANNLRIRTNTASALMKDFVKQGVLEEVTEKMRYRIYWFKDYVRIFNREL